MRAPVIDADDNGFAIGAVGDFYFTVKLNAPNGARHIHVVKNLVIGRVLVDLGRMLGIPRRLPCFD